MWSRSSSYQNGVRITSYKKWINITSRLPLQFKLPKNSSTTILTVIKPTQCPHSKLLAWIYLNTKTPLNPKCGLVCYNNFEWKLGCIDLYGRNYLSDKIYLGSNKQIAIGISYYNSDGYLTMNLMWKSEKEDPKSFEYVTNIYYYDFFNNNEHDIKATYGSYPGYLYFFGLTKEKIELSTFLSYVGAENYGEIIPVCVDCRYFKCPGLDVHILPHKPRNYYCTCPTKMVFDITRKRCVTTKSNCELPCAEGCVETSSEKYNLNCVRRCPTFSVISEVLGEFMTCKCPEREVYDYESKQCVITEDSHLILIITLCSIFGLIILTIAIIFILFRCGRCVRFKNWINNVINDLPCFKKEIAFDPRVNSVVKSKDVNNPDPSVKMNSVVDPKNSEIINKDHDNGSDIQPSIVPNIILVMNPNLRENSEIENNPSEETDSVQQTNAKAIQVNSPKNLKSSVYSTVIINPNIKQEDDKKADNKKNIPKNSANGKSSRKLDLEDGQQSINNRGDSELNSHLDHSDKHSDISVIPPIKREDKSGFNQIKDRSNKKSSVKNSYVPNKYDGDSNRDIFPENKEDNANVISQSDEEDRPTINCVFRQEFGPKPKSEHESAFNSGRMEEKKENLQKSPQPSLVVSSVYNPINDHKDKPSEEVNEDSICYYCMKISKSKLKPGFICGHRLICDNCMKSLSTFEFCGYCGEAKKISN